MTDGPGADRDALLRAEFRAFVREHHPDRGGDPAEFVAGLARFEAARLQAGHAASAPDDLADPRYDAPIRFVTPLPLPLRLAVAVIRTIRRQRTNRVQ